MNRLIEILKRHVLCVIIFFAIIVLWIFTLSFGKDTNVVSHLSLTSAVVSIVLAVIVIVYMYFQDQRSSQNITEMRSLVDQASRTMTDKADLMADQTQSLEKMIEGIIQPPADSDTTSTPLVLQKEGTLDISVYADWGLMILYALAKSHEMTKPMSWYDISVLLYIKKEDSMSSMTTALFYGFGVIRSLMASLGKDCLSDNHKQQEVKKLPNGFKESVSAQIGKNLKSYKDQGKDEEYTEMKRTFDVIDQYFNDL